MQQSTSGAKPPSTSKGICVLTKLSMIFLLLFCYLLQFRNLPLELRLAFIAYTILSIVQISPLRMLSFFPDTLFFPIVDTLTRVLEGAEILLRSQEKTVLSQTTRDAKTQTYGVHKYFILQTHTIILKFL